jgi:hypothetical protein
LDTESIYTSGKSRFFFAFTKISTKTFVQVTQTIVQRFGRQYSWDLKVRMMGQRQHEAAQLLVSELQLPYVNFL